MKMRCVSLLALMLGFATLAESADIYVIARESYNTPPNNIYQFGRFDIDNPDTTNGAGNFEYAFVPISTGSASAMANLAYNPTNSTMYVQLGFTSYRTIQTDGVVSGSLGTTSAGYGMAFDQTGNLYGTDMTDMLQLNPATGATIPPAEPLTAMIYSSFGGNMAWADDAFYYANEISATLAILGTDGTVLTIGSFTGQDYSPTVGHALFLHVNQLYLLNGLNLYEVNTATASLTKLGFVTGVAGDNVSQGFSGAVSLTPVPEPSTIAMAILATGAIGLVRRGRKAAR